jgi:uncharacterized membrane protein YfcA
LLLHIDSAQCALFLITLVAATVNGALGYGFSSITVPIALLFFSNRALSPALVLIELVVNAWVVWLNRASLAAARTRATPILIGLVPGIVIGSYLLSSLHPDWMKLCTYAALLPLILLQAGGFRRPIQREAAAGVPLGVGVGALYSATTISGPPLALMFNNQGLHKEQFRGALALVRVAETILTAAAYGFLGLYSIESLRLVIPIIPAVALGLPFGAYLIGRLNPETFRRTCMSFDAWIVGFGFARVSVALKLLSVHAAYGVWSAVIVFDLYLLYRFFFGNRLRTVYAEFPSGHFADLEAK